MSTKSFKTTSLNDYVLLNFNIFRYFEGIIYLELLKFVDMVFY